MNSIAISAGRATPGRRAAEVARAGCWACPHPRPFSPGARGGRAAARDAPNAKARRKPALFSHLTAPSPSGRSVGDEGPWGRLARAGRLNPKGGHPAEQSPRELEGKRRSRSDRQRDLAHKAGENEQAAQTVAVTLVRQEEAAEAEKLARENCVTGESQPAPRGEHIDTETGALAVTERSADTFAAMRLSGLIRRAGARA